MISFGLAAAFVPSARFVFPVPFKSKSLGKSGSLELYLNMIKKQRQKCAAGPDCCHNTGFDGESRLWWVDMLANSFRQSLLFVKYKAGLRYGHCSACLSEWR